MIFWYFNRTLFEWPGLNDALRILFWGGYFDFISMFYCFSPFILGHLIPGNWFFIPRVQKTFKIFYSCILFLLITLTCIDAGYYPFAKTRMGITLFKMAGNESVSLITYILDYWEFIPFILFFTWAAWKLYPNHLMQSPVRWYLRIPLNLLFLALLVLTIRGGFRLKPLRSIDTALFVSPAYASLSISTGFNVLESMQVESIEVPGYFDDATLKRIMQKDYHTLEGAASGAPKNIILVILESFGKEYSFPEIPGAVSYTPFLQQLARVSTFYTCSYSNGTRSVDAIPAILEGVPKLTKTDFMYSGYIKNITPGFPYYLAKLGYSSHFYHGGKNGTLGFEAFLKSRGWNYYGLNEYSGPQSDFDGQWGVFDGPYLRYVADRLALLKQPFTASVFTLSSHHPYTLPDAYRDSFLDARKPIHRTIRYTDACLRVFFEEIKNQPWFRNSIVVVTADHSSENFTKRYQSRSGKYEVPLLVYDPSNPRGAIDSGIIQHIDIVPLALEKAGYRGQIFTLGTYFAPPSEKLAFQNEDGNYQLIQAEYIHTFDGFRGNTVKRNTTSPQGDALTLDLNAQLKSIIQDYYYRLEHNTLY